MVFLLCVRCILRTLVRYYGYWYGAKYDRKIITRACFSGICVVHYAQVIQIVFHGRLRVVSTDGNHQHKKTDGLHCCMRALTRTRILPTPPAVSGSPSYFSLSRWCTRSPELYTARETWCSLWIRPLPLPLVFPVVLFRYCYTTVEGERRETDHMDIDTRKHTTKIYHVTCVASYYGGPPEYCVIHTMYWWDMVRRAGSQGCAIFRFRS